MYNILHINSETNWAGGEVQTLNLCKGLKERGHNCIIACPPRSKLSERARNALIPVEIVKMSSVHSLTALLKLINVIKKNKIDIVHMHTFHAHRLGAIASTLAQVKARITTRRMTYEIENNIINRFMYKACTNKIIAVSNSVKEAIFKLINDDSKVEVIYDGIELSKFKEIKNTTNKTINNHRKVIGTVSHLYRRKGLQYLLEAASEVVKFYPDTLFIIVGDGPLKKELQLQVNKLNIKKNVVFKEFQDDIPSILSNIDIYVQSSIEEALGVAILEAMAMKKPVIATKIGGIPEIIQDGITGVLVPPKDAQALHDAITLLLNNPKKLSEIGINGHSHIEMLFSNDKMILSYEKVYRELLNS